MKVLLTVLAAVALTAADQKSLEQSLADGNNQFTAKFFSEVVKAKPSQSVVLSAFSVLPPLAQLALASVGESHDELLGAIGLQDDNITKEAFMLLNTRLHSFKGFSLNMANRIYIAENVELNQDFAKLANDVFQSEVKNVDFAKNVETAQEINSWVEEHTKNRIKDLVNSDSINANTHALLVNALYFKGFWDQKFLPEMTSEQDFHVNNKTIIKVPTMNQDGYFSYTESEELDAKLLEMAYEGDEASFLVVVPNEVEGLAALEEKLQDPSALPKAIEKMDKKTVKLYLPKFKIETTTNLKDVLKNVGVNKLFTSGEARLDNLLKGSKDLYLDSATQKTFIEVYEGGTEAAAANELAGPGGVPNMTVLRADRPFYFEIKVNENPAINLDMPNQPTSPTLSLFTGVYVGCSPPTQQ